MKRPFSTLLLSRKSFTDGTFSHLFSFLRTVPATVRVLADACHEERRRAKCELCHKPGQMMPGHTTDMSYGWLHERTKQNNYEGNKQNQLSCCLVEQAAVSDGHQLRQSKNPSY
jgi:hypothetical protein